jgi:hypothetical protein
MENESEVNAGEGKRRINTNFGLYNVTDEKYSEGSFAMSPARNWIFRNTLKF